MKILMLFLFAFTCAAQTPEAYLKSKMQTSIFFDLNKHRIDRGLDPLEYRYDMQDKCDAWVLKMEKSLMHSADNYLGEVIGQSLASELIIPLYLQSEVHRRILLDKKAKGVCVAIHYKPEYQIVKGATVEYIPPMYYTVIRTY